MPAGSRALAAHMGPKGRLDDGRFVGWVDATERLCRHGHLRGAVLVMLVDMAAGYVAEANSERDWSFTADLSVRRTLTPVTTMTATPVVQRAGRSISIDVPLADADGVPVAHGVSTFARMPMRPDDPPRPDYPVEAVGRFSDDSDVDLVAALAARDTADGIEVDLDAALLNPAGVLQGGVAALIAEVAAERVLEAAAGTALVATAIDTRYVGMGRVGPIRARVAPLAGPGHSAVVRLLDTGADDRVVTHTLIDFADPTTRSEPPP